MFVGGFAVSRVARGDAPAAQAPAAQLIDAPRQRARAAGVANTVLYAPSASSLSYFRISRRFTVNQHVAGSSAPFEILALAKKGKKKGKSKGADVEDDEPLDEPAEGEARAGEQAPADEKQPNPASERVDSPVATGRRLPGTHLRLENVQMYFPKNEVLKDVSWEVKPGERVGLVGSNGAGKTTQLKIILGKQEATSGEVYIPSNWHVAYLTQEFEVDEKRTVREEFYSAYARQMQVLRELKEVEAKMNTQDMDELQKLIEQLDLLQREAETFPTLEEVDARIAKIMPQLGFTEEHQSKLVSEFSGGWQMRMSLGKILLQDPDLLLLDEPTNHLDLDTIEWLEEYLKSRTCAMVVVSHDRYFLDRICTKIVETERGISTTYNDCNYTKFLARKQANLDAQQAAYDRQQKEIAKQRAFIQKMGAKAATAAQAKAREKQLEKMEKVPKPSFTFKQIKFSFQEPPRSGREVITIEGCSKKFGEKVILDDAELVVERGDRIAFVGPNGAGKSTVLEMIMGNMKQDSGSVRFGEHNIFPAYYAQNQADALDLDRTVLQTLEETGVEMKHEDMRALLGKFLFKGDTIQKPVGALSGGEKSRLAFARMLLRPANVLLLDEPTNHIDLAGKEVLEEALVDFQGTLLVVSHDRYFISKVANKIVELRDGKFRVYPGDYKYYLEKINEEREQGILRAEIAAYKALEDLDAALEAELAAEGEEGEEEEGEDAALEGAPEEADVEAALTS
eukprot:tig00000949_g5734.t1